MTTKEIIYGLANWAHDEMFKIEKQTLALEASRKTLKTDEEQVRCLFELNELSGYAKAIVELQHKLLELLKAGNEK